MEGDKPYSSTSVQQASLFASTRLYLIKLHLKVTSAEIEESISNLGFVNGFFRCTVIDKAHEPCDICAFVDLYSPDDVWPLLSHGLIVGGSKVSIRQQNDCEELTRYILNQDEKSIWVKTAKTVTKKKICKIFKDNVDAYLIYEDCDMSIPTGLCIVEFQSSSSVAEALKRRIKVDNEYIKVMRKSPENQSIRSGEKHHKEHRNNASKLNITSTKPSVHSEIKLVPLSNSARNFQDQDQPFVRYDIMYANGQEFIFEFEREFRTDQSFQDEKLPRNDLGNLQNPSTLTPSGTEVRETKQKK